MAILVNGLADDYRERMYKQTHCSNFRQSNIHQHLRPVYSVPPVSDDLRENDITKVLILRQ